MRLRGEEMWVGDQHIGNLRLSPNEAKPVVVQDLDGAILYQAASRRAAEVWATVHAQELLQQVTDR